MEENTVNNPVSLSTNQIPPVTDVNQTPPVPDSEKPNRKFSLGTIIGIIIFLLLAGGAAAGLTVLKPHIEKFVSKPTPSPTTTVRTSPSPTMAIKTENETLIQSLGNGQLKQLKSHRYNISFNFPGNWQYIKNAEGKFGLSYVFPSGEGDLVTDGEGCGFYLGNHGGGDGPTKTYKNSTVLFGDKKMTARSWFVTADSTPVFNYYFDEDENKTFVIWSWISRENRNTCQESINQILSSFKFTENSVDNQLLLERQDEDTRNTLVEFSNANIRYYTTHAGFPWNEAGPCQSSATANPPGIPLNQMVPCISLLIKEGELKNSFLSANGQSISKIFVNSENTSLNICYKPSSIKEQVKPETTYDVYGKVDKSCSTTNNKCFWCSNS